MKITVMGLGYIGLPTAITLAEAGFEVCGFDVNKNTIETLQGGHIHIVEPGLQEAFEKAVARRAWQVRCILYFGSDAVF